MKLRKLSLRSGTSPGSRLLESVVATLTKMLGPSTWAVPVHVVVAVKVHDHDHVKVNVKVYGPIESSAMRSITCALVDTRGLALSCDA